MNIATHAGKVIYNTIKKSGYSFIYVSKKLECTRNSLYKKLKQEHLSVDFINKIGNIIHYDFSNDFPQVNKLSLNTRINDINVQNKENEIVNAKKYSDLLSQYNTLLDFMISIANEHNISELKKELREFINERNI